MRNLLKSLGTDGSCAHFKERLGALIEPLSNHRPSWEKRVAADAAHRLISAKPIWEQVSASLKEVVQVVPWLGRPIAPKIWRTPCSMFLQSAYLRSPRNRDKRSTEVSSNTTDNIMPTRFRLSAAVRTVRYSISTHTDFTEAAERTSKK